MLFRITIILLFISHLFSQTFNFSGIIIDASSGDGLAYANISIPDNSLGTASDNDGNFSIKLTPGKYDFLVSFIGYKTETLEIEITDTDVEKIILLTSTDVLLQEISVYSTAWSNNSAASSVSLKSKEIEKISSVFPDVFRSIQALPGLSVNNEFSAKFNVRGGNYDENLVLVNGTQVYEPFHLKEAENASVGIFNLDLMKKVNIITGGFSAEYGDRLSSVLNIEYREGDSEKYKGSATFSLLNIDGYVEGPVTQNMNFILGVRKSYLKYIMQMLDFADYVKPDFYDIQGVITYNLPGADKMQFKFIHAGDDFSYLPGWESNGPFNYSSGSGNNRILLSESETDFEENRANYYSNLFDIKGSFFFRTKRF
jgi:hypothetical protein